MMQVTMRKNISTVLVFAASLMLLSCTRNFEQYNGNPYGVASKDMFRDG